MNRFTVAQGCILAGHVVISTVFGYLGYLGWHSVSWAFFMWGAYWLGVITKRARR